MSEQDIDGVVDERAVLVVKRLRELTQYAIDNWPQGLMEEAANVIEGLVVNANELADQLNDLRAQRTDGSERP